MKFERQLTALCISNNKEIDGDQSDPTNDHHGISQPTAVVENNIFFEYPYTCSFKCTNVKHPLILLTGLKPNSEK